MTSTPDSISFLSHYLDRRVELGDTPSAVMVLSSKGDEHIMSATVGANPVDCATRFPIASLTKAFTATAVLQLVERKVLALDEPLTEYLDDSVPSTATLRQLLTHSAGASQAGHKQYLLDNTLGEAASGVDFVSSPATRISYSNFGYHLAAQVVEVAAKVPYEDYVRDNILEPLAMAKTDFTHDYSTQGWMQRDSSGTRALAPAATPTLLRGANDMVSTAEDLARWMKFWLHGDDAVLGAVLRTEALRTQWYQPSSGVRWGFGFEFVGDDPSLARNIGHFLGWHHCMLLDPIAKTGCVVLSNCIDSAATKWARTGVSALAFDDSSVGTEDEHFTGLYYSPWLKSCIVCLDGRLAAVSLDETDPFTEPDWLERVDETTLLVKEGWMYSAVGETVIFDPASDRVFYGPDEIQRLGPLATI